MTYKLYIFNKKKTDGMESWIDFLKEHDSTYNQMNEKMQKQYATKTYGLRFIIRDWEQRTQHEADSND